MNESNIISNKFVSHEPGLVFVHRNFIDVAKKKEKKDRRYEFSDKYVRNFSPMVYSEG